MLGNFQPHAIDYLRFLPEILLSIAGIAIMMLEVLTSERQKNSLGVLSLIGIVAAFIANLFAYADRGPAFHNMIVIDGYGTFFRALVLVVGFLCILPSFHYLQREKGEYGRILCAYSVFTGWPMRARHRR